MAFFSLIFKNYLGCFWEQNLFLEKEKSPFKGGGLPE